MRKAEFADREILWHRLKISSLDNMLGSETGGGIKVKKHEHGNWQGKGSCVAGGTKGGTIVSNPVRWWGMREERKGIG